MESKPAFSVRTPIFISDSTGEAGIGKSWPNFTVIISPLYGEGGDVAFQFFV
jgi:hypothetical protein